MILRDLFDLELFFDMLDNGYIRRQWHPAASLAILNYTEKSTFDRVWNEVTMTCRGLIYDWSTEQVVARPFRKFFNYGEPGAELGAVDEPVVVTDKLDGSLGVLYLNPQTMQYEIATRGSFTSEQALHATELLHERYGYWIPSLFNATYLFEIVYPKNRIVVDYGEVDDLFLLGAVHNWTGESIAASALRYDWPGPVVQEMHAVTFSEALELKPRPNAEGVVVRFLVSDTRVKVKQDDYIALHQLITGMNARVIWERLGDGDTADDLCSGVPEEFWPWIRETARELVAKRDDILAASRREHMRIVSRLPDGWARKDFAAQALMSPYKAYLFMLLDGRDPSSAIWKTLRPSADRMLMGRTEDVA